MREAADILGVSKEAVRKRVIRGTLRSDVGGDGRRYVYLDADTDEAPTHESASLISEMRSRIDSLEHQLEQANERDRENRRIIAALTSRIPELEPPSSEEPRESPETASEPVAKGGAREAPFTHEERAQEAAQPRSGTSWWRRILRG
jgi:hypothetical protein